MTGSRTCFSRAFHVERHQSGCFAGNPIFLGHSVAAVAACSTTRTAWCGPRSTMPSRWRPSGDHRSGAAIGGSLTTSSPPTCKNAHEHSATTAGGPKLRATTRSKAPRQRSSCAARSARSRRTTTRAPLSSSSAVRPLAFDRRSLTSRRTHCYSVQWSANTRPGIPPPLPRSSACPGDGTTANSSACVTCAATGPGPTNPSRWARSRTPISRSFRRSPRPQPA